MNGSRHVSEGAYSFHVHGDYLSRQECMSLGSLKYMQHASLYNMWLLFTHVWLCIWNVWQCFPECIMYGMRGP